MKEYPRARKRFGQHFLEPAWVARLVALMNPGSDETVLEIGPGRGALTRVLAPRVARLVCIEIDRDLAERLRTSAPPNVEVVTGDVLATDLTAVLGSSHGARIIGNLPYNVASPILFKLLHDVDAGAAFVDATVMLQREVADRLAAAPGSADYGALAIQASRVAEVTSLLTLPQVFADVPTPDMLNGDFSFGGQGFPIFDPASTVQDAAGNRPWSASK